MSILRKAQSNIPGRPVDPRTQRVGPEPDPCRGVLSPEQMMRGWTCENGIAIPPRGKERSGPDMAPGCDLRLSLEEEFKGWTIDQRNCVKVPPVDGPPNIPGNPFNREGVTPGKGKELPSSRFIDPTITPEMPPEESSGDIFNRRGGSFRRKGGVVMGSGNWRGKAVPGMRRGGVVRKK